jgi:hypothetical protein
MSEEKSQEAFLGRWSRLKEKAREEREVETRSPAPVAEAQPQPAPAAPLPAVEDLKPDSDFKPFMGAQVDPATRRSALKKLFTDPHYKTIDPFEPYSIDLTGEDPIPEAMLKTLDHARRVMFDEKEEAAKAAAAAEQQRAEASPQPEPEPEDVPGKQDA